jgi:hypothetical protein
MLIINKQYLFIRQKNKVTKHCVLSMVNFIIKESNMATNSNKQTEKYNKPELRDKIKQELKQSDKGGKPGQWSARKSQLLVKEYEKQGGGYTGEKDEKAHSLEEWTKQEWQTKDGQSQARQKDKTKRYLPKEVWNKLTEQEKNEAEQTKVKGSKKGDQHIVYTKAVKKALQEVKNNTDKEPTKADLYDQAQKLNIEGRSKMNKAQLQKAIDKAK